MQYRRDIDGLRGIAVASVVLFHAGVPGFPGGFLGVDIFFVISGFLITRIIVDEVSGDRFSFLNFYDRRIRRIFPVLLTVYLFCVVCGLVVSMPTDLRNFGESLTSSSYFFSNNYFYGATGYFDAPAHTKPLLHTWSLSVEEQFYLLWPLAIILLWRCRSASLRLSILLAVAAISFGYREWALAGKKPEAAFYLLPARGWELIIGAALAMIIARLTIAARLANLFAGIGVAFIVIAVASGSAENGFPGLNAVFACVGAALIILAGHRNAPIVSRLYANDAVVFVGLISYSLYLWHWPLFSYWQIATDQPPSAADAAGLILASVLLAALSYRFIERPFRQWRPDDRRLTIRVGVAAIGAFAIIGVVTSNFDGFPGRFNAQAREIFALSRQKISTIRCTSSEGGKRDLNDCPLGVATETTPPQVLLIGDSHALHYAPALDEVLKQNGMAGQILARGSCPPLLDVKLFRQGERRSKCRDFVSELRKLVADNSEVKLVVFAARWALYSEDNWQEAVVQDAPMRLTDNVDRELIGSAASRRVLERSLRRMIGNIVKSGKQVLLLGQIPPYPTRPSSCIARARIYTRPEEPCFAPAPLVRERLAFSNTLLRRLAADFEGVYAFIPSDIVCDDKVCPPFLNGVFLYRDNNHMNAEGAKQLARYLANSPAFRPQATTVSRPGLSGKADVPARNF